MYDAFIAAPPADFDNIQVGFLNQNLRKFDSRVYDVGSAGDPESTFIKLLKVRLADVELFRHAANRPLALRVVIQRFSEFNKL